MCQDEAAMGQGRRKGRKKEAGGGGKEQNPWEWGETLGGARTPEWTPSPTEWKERRGGREASGVGGSNRLLTTQPVIEKAGGGESSQYDSTPNGGRGGVESWQDDSTQNENRGGVESSQVEEPGETKPWDP